MSILKVESIREPYNNTEAMFIDSSGDVTFSGSVVIPGTISGVDLATLNTTVSTLATDLTSLNSTVGNIVGLPEAIDVNASAPADSLNIDASGKVGIGTSSPETPLHIKSSGNSVVKVESTTANANVVFRDGTASADVTVGSVDNGEFRVQVNNSERMRIDSSGNLLVGKTSSNTHNSTAGSEILENGFAAHTRAGVPLLLNRLSSDGSIAIFRKDGSTVGSISTGYGVVDIKGGSAGLLMGNSAVLPVNGSGTLTDGSYNIGASSFRFQDLYLSGGVYVGGTGNANYLDDYEEGTFTPDLQFNTGNSGMTYHSRAGYYTKIGNVVTIWGFCKLANKGTVSGVANIANLPFTPHNAGQNHMCGTFASANNMSSMPQTNIWVMPYYSGRMYIRYQASGGEGSITNSNFTNDSTFSFTATYKIN